ncbi:hypothetical protein B0H19DRAFT_1258288 [Mycena capillaripes]|nr:hypothetical protein B0H19DRAFT_1258288 [Mycena capillaripes]
MQIPSYAATLRVVLVGILFSLSLVSALPALLNSDPAANPASLLGRSYTRRAADSPLVHASRQLALDAQTQQLDSHSPLGRAERFQLAQRRAANSPVSLRAADENQAQAGDVLEARENLLSHQQAVPSLASSLNPSSSSIPAIPTATSIPTTVPQSTAAPGARVVKSKSKKTKPLLSKHAGHKTAKVAHESAE